MASFYRLSIVSMLLSAAVWPQFSTQSCCCHVSSTCTELPYPRVDCSVEQQRYHSVLL